MVVGVLSLDLRLFEIRTLKEKRSVISRLLNRLRSRLPVSIAEVGHQDLLQRTMLGCCVVAGTEKQIRSVFDSLEKEVYASGQAEIINLESEFLHYGDEVR